MGAFANFALVPEQGVTPELAQLPEDMQAQIRALAARLDVRDNAALIGGLKIFFEKHPQK